MVPVLPNKIGPETEYMYDHYIIYVQKYEGQWYKLTGLEGQVMFFCQENNFIGGISPFHNGSYFHDMDDIRGLIRSIKISDGIATKESEIIGE